MFSFICNRKRQPGKIRRGRLFAGDFCGENFSFGSTVAIQHETLAIVIASLVFLSVFSFASTVAIQHETLAMVVLCRVLRCLCVFPAAYSHNDIL